MKTALLTFKLMASLFVALYSQSAAATFFVIDTSGGHAFIEFKVEHLGYSLLSGRFNSFEGSFSFTENNPADAEVNVTIDTTSIDSNHAERDKHLRSDNYLDTEEYPEATFESTHFEYEGKNDATGKHIGKLHGKLTLHGVTNPIVMDVIHIGQGRDPWLGYRSGFQGWTSLKLTDYGYDFEDSIGPYSNIVELHLGVEGIRRNPKTKRD